MNAELLPCPFCGEGVIVNPMESMFKTWKCGCPQCECFGPEKMTYDDAVLAWNTRATQPQAPQGGVTAVAWADAAHAVITSDGVEWICEVPFPAVMDSFEIFLGDTPDEAIAAAMKALAPKTETPEAGK